MALPPASCPRHPPPSSSCLAKDRCGFSVMAQCVEVTRPGQPACQRQLGTVAIGAENDLLAPTDVPPEHHLVAGAVQDQPDEPAADVAGAEVDSDAGHAWLTAFRRS